MQRVNILPGTGLLVALVLGQLGAFQNQIRQIRRKLGNDHVAVGIPDVVAVISVQQQSAVLGVRDPVIFHLLGGQVIVVHPDAVEVHGTLAAANGDICRNDLGEVIVCRVLHHTAHHAIDIAVDSTEAGSFLHHKAHTDVFLFLELHGDGTLLRGEHTGLGSQGNATATVQAGENHRIVVQHIPCRKLNLDGLAGGTEVLGEGLIGNGQPCIAKQPQSRDAILVHLPSIRCPVEIVEFSRNVPKGPHRRVGFLVGSGSRGKIQTQILRFRRHINLGSFHIEGDGLGNSTRGNGNGDFSRVVHTVGKYLLTSIHRNLTDHSFAYLDDHIAHLGRRAVDDIGNGDGGVLHDVCLMEA